LMIAKLGAGENFYVQTAFYVGMLWLVTMVVVPPLRDIKHKDSVVYSLKEGITYVWHHPTLRTQMALALVPMAVGLPYMSLLLVFTGMFQMLYMTTNQTLIQVSIPDEVRGRVNGIYMLNQGLLPLGTLFAGAMSDVLSAPIVVFTMGVFVALLAVSFGLKARNI